MTPPPLRKLRLPIVLAVLLGAVYGAAFVLAGSPEGLGLGVTHLRWLFAALLAALGIVGVRALRFFVLDVVFLRAQGHRAPALVHVVVSLALYFVLGLLIAGGVFGQSLTGAIATSAVASVVLGLALQETLGNFFAGIALQVEQPFRLGDVIRTGSSQGALEGRVESFNWRATTIRTTNDARIVIPNSVVAREPLEVFARSHTNRRVVKIPAAYEAAPRRVIGLVREAVAAVPGVAERPPPRVRVGAFDASSVTYEVLYWVEDYMQVAEIDAQVRERVWYVYARNGLSIPFPHLQLLYDREDTPGRNGESTVDEDDLDAPVREREQRLGEVPLLGPLTAEERWRLAERARTLLFGPGERILKAGREGGSMFVILSGRVEIRVPTPEGGCLTVAEIGPGEVFGEMSLLTGEPRSADAWAIGEVELVEVRKAEMGEVLTNNEALAEAFAQQVSTRREERSEAFARADVEMEEPTSEASLLQRIRQFFDLN